MILSKLSRLSRFAFKLLKNISISSFTFLSTFLLLIKFYMTMNDLFVMFVEKSKSLNLSLYQKNSYFLYNKQLSKFISHQTRITSYFLSSFNSFKFNISSKLKLCLLIQINVLRRHILFCDQNINFASQYVLSTRMSSICRRCKQIFEFEN